MFEMASVKRPGMGTMAVDQYWRMYYDPQFLVDKTPEEIASVIQHELCHLVFKHHKRGRFLLGDKCTAENNRNWQLSTDAAINEILLRERIPLPGEPITRHTLYQMFGIDVGQLPSAEEAYRKLQECKKDEAGEFTEFFEECLERMRDDDRENYRENDNGQAGEEGGGSSGGSGSPGEERGGPGGCDGGSEGHAEEFGGHDSKERGDHNEDRRDAGNPDGGGAEGGRVAGNPGEADDSGELGDDGSGTCDGSATVSDLGQAIRPDPISGSSGSCADGIPKPWELGPPEEKGEGVGNDREGIVVETIARNVLEGRGNVPGKIRVWATKILDPAIDPRQKILNVIHKHVDLARGRGRRSYRRPNRRFSGSDFIMPTAFAPVPRIAVCVDSSGSMRDTDKALAIGLINKVLSSFPNRRGIRVVVGDTEGRVTELAHSRLNRLKDVGGGGTNMAQLIKDAIKSDPKPQVILVATDGDTPWPAENPGVPVLACLTRRGYQDRVPEWITTLMICGEER